MFLDKKNKQIASFVSSLNNDAVFYKYFAVFDQYFAVFDQYIAVFDQYFAAF